MAELVRKDHHGLSEWTPEGEAGASPVTGSRTKLAGSTTESWGEVVPCRNARLKSHVVQECDVNV